MPVSLSPLWKGGGVSAWPWSKTIEAMLQMQSLVLCKLEFLIDTTGLLTHIIKSPRNIFINLSVGKTPLFTLNATLEPQQSYSRWVINFLNLQLVKVVTGFPTRRRRQLPSSTTILQFIIPILTLFSYKSTAFEYRYRKFIHEFVPWFCGTFECACAICMVMWEGLVRDFPSISSYVSGSTRITYPGRPEYSDKEAKSWGRLISSCFSLAFHCR